jgi:hypothetical protein
MTLFRTALMGGLAVALSCGVADAQTANRAASKMITLQMPATPEPVRVTLDPKSTALIVLDYVEDICAKQPSCKERMLPARAVRRSVPRETSASAPCGTVSGR